MGRAKLSIKLIEDRKARKITFNRRIQGLKKKAYEFSTLCDVDTCLICFSEDSNKPISWPEDPAEARRIIRRYQMTCQEESAKKLQRPTTAMQDDLSTLFHTWDDRLDNWPASALGELLSSLDEKIEMVRKRIESLEGSNPCLEQPNQLRVQASSCNFPLQLSPSSCENMEEQKSYGEANSLSHPSTQFEKFSETNNFNSSSSSSLSTLPMFNQESSVSMLNSISNPSPHFEKFSEINNFSSSSLSMLPQFNQESSMSMPPLFSQEVGAMPMMNSQMLSQSNESDGCCPSFHQEQWFQGSQYFVPDDFPPLDPQYLQPMLLHPQAHHWDYLGLSEFQDFEVVSRFAPGN
ncbi:hypothetical protein ACLOJK_007820 [Asimina triloba]